MKNDWDDMEEKDIEDDFRDDDTAIVSYKKNLTCEFDQRNFASIERMIEKYQNRIDCLRSEKFYLNGQVERRILAEQATVAMAQKIHSKLEKLENTRWRRLLKLLRVV